MVKKTIGHAAHFIGSLAIIISAVMLTVTIILPFIVESFGSRGVTALIIMEMGGMTLGYYGYTIGMFIVMISLGVVCASLGRYVVETLED
jgi:hypothetical protein